MIKTKIVDDMEAEELYWTDLGSGDCFVINNHHTSSRTVFIVVSTRMGNKHIDISSGMLYGDDQDASITQVYPKNPFEFKLVKPEEV
jgi:hypothetical protein